MWNTLKKQWHKVRDIFSRWKSIDISLPCGKENDVVFCFGGEFGYELISWIPYLLFLKKTTGIYLHTVSRPGSKVFYHFSDKHDELEPEEITVAWGDSKKYKRALTRLGFKNGIYPANEYSKERRIIVNGYEWTTKDIHTRIEETNYEKLNLTSVVSKLPFDFKKFVVINNKYTKEWFGPPINFFDRQDLVNLCDLLLKNGYSVVYNRFVEKTAIDEDLPLKDEDIFSVGKTYDMRRFYEGEKDILIRNTTQLAMFNKADFVIGVQGGNVYLPALCKKDIYMLMKKGNYLDYTELGRLFGAQVELFYDSKHLIRAIRERLLRE